MLVNYFVSLGLLAGTYIRIEMELRSSQTIGENAKKQQDTVKSNWGRGGGGGGGVITITQH